MGKKIGRKRERMEMGRLGKGKRKRRWEEMEVIGDGEGRKNREEEGKKGD